MKYRVDEKNIEQIVPKNNHYMDAEAIHSELEILNDYCQNAKNFGDIMLIWEKFKKVFPLVNYVFRLASQ